MAHELAGRFLASDWRDGTPAIRVGRLLRVPRAALEQLMGTLISDIPATIARVSTAKQRPTTSARRLYSVSDEPQLPLA